MRKLMGEEKNDDDDEDRTTRVRPMMQTTTSMTKLMMMMIASSCAGPGMLEGFDLAIMFKILQCPLHWFLARYPGG